MEVAPFFVDFHHFLSIFTIFYQFSRFTHFCRDWHFVAIYALFPQFFLAKIAFSATSHVFCMYVLNITGTNVISLHHIVIYFQQNPLYLRLADKYLKPMKPQLFGWLLSALCIHAHTIFRYIRPKQDRNKSLRAVEAAPRETSKTETTCTKNTQQ